MMNDSTKNYIITVLNSTEDIGTKESKIYTFCNSKHDPDTECVSIICRLLSDYVLPYNHNESMQISNNINDHIYDVLENIVDNSTCVFFNATCNELLWTHYHKAKFAIEALNSYMQELDVPSHKDEYYKHKVIFSICRIYSKFSSADFNYSDFFDRAVTYAHEYVFVEKHGLCSILQALSSCKIRLEDIEKIYEKAIANCNQNNWHYHKVMLQESLLDFYIKHNNNEKANKLKVEIAISYEQQADSLDPGKSGNLYRIEKCLHNAMSLWDKCNDKSRGKEERNRLAKKIEPVQKQIIQQMPIFKVGPIDMSVVNKNFDDFIKNASFINCVHKLAYLFNLEGPEDVINDNRKAPGFFSSLFSMTVLDNNGKKRCIIPSAINATDEEKEKIAIHRITEGYRNKANMFVCRFLDIAKEKYEFNEYNLNFLVDNNAFIPDEIKRTVLKGLVSGFNSDYSTSMHLLMPRMEYAIRALAKECGAVVYKTDNDGIESALSLTSLLELPEVVECLDETFLFNLKLFYTSSYGFGMRDIIAHGLESDSDLNSQDALAVWWFTLRVCCMFSPKALVNNAL